LSISCTSSLHPASVSGVQEGSTSEIFAEFHPDVQRALVASQPTFQEVDALTARHMRRMLAAFQAARVAPYHWSGSSGYGRGDAGREPLEQVLAQVFGAEAACVRPQFQSGTHAIACALFGVLRPGQEVLVVSGAPYDTLEEVFGQRSSGGAGSSLSDFNIGYRQVDLTGDGALDLDAIAASIRPETRCCHIQRSCGYTVRKSISIDNMAEAIALIKRVAPQCVVTVDNCYGEFVEDVEPTAAGADLIMGSLIKNPGGTLATCGGYIAGKEELVRLAAERLSSPGVGYSAGACSGEWTRLMFQGFFLAPQMVGEARKGGFLVAEAMARAGFAVRPPVGDAVTAVTLDSEALLLQFCRAIMSNSPVNSYVQPLPGATPGYESEVVFADGTFVEGSTSELSADGPMRAPYAAFCQGGTHWVHWAIAIEKALLSLSAVESEI